MNMKLYEIAETYADFMAALEADEIPEEAIADTLESIQGEADEKIDSIACMIKEMNADALAIREEARKLTERARAKEAHADRLKTYLERWMPELGYGRSNKFESARNRISWRKSSALITGELFPVWAAKNRPDLLKYEPRTADIKKAVKNGEAIEFAEIVERESMSIQ